jgi:hypothetical protein
MIVSIEEAKAILGESIPDKELERLLHEAEILIAEQTLGLSTLDLEGHYYDCQIKYLKEAIIKQVEYWNYIDPNMDLVGLPTSMTVDGVQMQHSIMELSPRSRRCLRLAGFLSNKVVLR